MNTTDIGTAGSSATPPAAPPPDTEHGLDLQQVQAFAGQVVGLLIGGATTAMIVVGDRVGLYAALAASGPVTSAQLAASTGLAERYVREWLAQQAAVGIVKCDTEQQTFVLPPEHAAVLATDDSPASAIGGAPLITGMHRLTDRLADAFRTGEGISWTEQDDTIFDSTERFWRVSYRNSLISEWVPALDGVEEKLRSGAYVADIGCGCGAALILLAQAFPNSRFVGYDIHEPSVAIARERAAEAGVADRVSFEVNYCQGYPQDGYDLITFFDAFHDLGDPPRSAEYAHEALDDDGTLMLVEPVAGDDLASTLTVPTAGLGLAASTFMCIPNSLSQPGSVALGGQAGIATLREILGRAGFGTSRKVAQNMMNMVVEARKV